MRYQCKIVLGFILFCFTTVFGVYPVIAQDVISESDPSITTDKLSSGDMVLGINSNGGGVVNYLFIPGIGNIFGPQSVKYGRSGQSAIRDGLHGGKYNPTQAGFNETLGTKCIVEKDGDHFLLPARPVALWYGDCDWDFTEWENIGADAACYIDGGNSDVDEIDESNLVGKQNTEVKSEFDYNGFYADYKGKAGIDIACIRHYFEYRFVRPPGHCISQFRPGLSIYKPDQINPDISSHFPAGKHSADPFDMSDFLLSWHMRNDVENWDPKYRYVKNSDGTWNVNVKDRSEALVYETYSENEHPIVPRLVVLSDSDNPETGNALGFYMPESDFNKYQTIGVNEKTDSIVYKDNRFTSVKLWDQARRIPTMAVYGFKVESNGILNRTRLDENVYEAFRFDLFMLMGSPNEIWETVNRIEKASFVWNFSQNNEGWKSTENSTVSVKDSILHIEQSGADQILESPDSLMVDSRLQRFLVFRLKNHTSQNSLAIRFLKYDKPEIFTQVIPVSTMDDEWKTYKINMSKNADWKGMVRQFSIAVPAGSGKIEFDGIAASSDAISDCNGVFEGSAFLDACNTCVGGNTGKSACEDCMGVPGGSAYLNECGTCVGGPSVVVPVNEWNFNELSDWTLNERITGYTNTGVAYLNIIGNDPYMNYNKSLCVNSITNHFLKLKVKNNCNGGALSFYFQNSISNAWKFASIPVSQNDTELKTYTIDLATNPDWIGNIHKIRLDPPGTGGAFELDYVALDTDDQTTSIEQTKNLEELKIFPNPSLNTVSIQTITPSMIIVYTISGQEIFQSKELQYKNELDVSGWSPGIYLVKASSGEKSINQKMIVQ